MNATESFNGFAGEEWVRREGVVRRFEGAWRRGPRPALDEYLDAGPGRRGLLIELVHVDLEFRHRAGEAAVVEEYLRRYPELGDDRGDVFGLYEAERDLCRRYGPADGTRTVEQKSEGRGQRSEEQDYDLTSDLRPRSPVPARLGKFRLGEELGAGAFGTVYRAEDTRLRRPVALKVLHRGGGPVSDRFLREAQSAGQLRHPGIAAVYEAGQDQGFAYLASEYVPGQTLAQRLQAGPLPARAAAELLAQVADALDYAHRQGVIHRDVKPSNVQIDPDGRPHLLDFGLARWEAGEGTLTRDGDLLGTPAYVSPEQARGQAHWVDGRGDVYSLGVVLYEALTGALPFRGDPTSILRQVLEEEPKPPRRLNPGIPRDLETVCLKAMAKHPADRYATAAALADDLRRFLQGAPVKARAVGPLGRARRWCRRNPVPAGLGAVLAVALLGVGWQWHRAEANLADARRETRRADANLRQAHQVLGKFTRLDCIYAPDNKLDPEVHLARIRIASLELTIEYYEDLLLREKIDLSLQVDMAAAYQRRALLYAETRQPTGKTRAAFEKARACYRELADANPGAADYAYGWALACYEQGRYLCDEGCPAEALAAHELAGRRLSALVREHPDRPGYRKVLGMTLYHTGRDQARLGQAAAARSSYLKAAALFRGLAEEFPKVPAYQRDLAASYHNVGNLHRDAGAFAEAAPFYRRALPIWEKLRRDHPERLNYSSDESGTCFNLGEVLERLGDLKGAFAAYHRALELERRVAAKRPGDGACRERLAQREQAVARTRQALGKTGA
jgi:serine/threonine-protein kinase